MKIKKEKQKHYYDRNIREYETILTDDIIEMKTPGSKNWTQGICIEEISPKKFKVEVDDKKYIRKRKDLKIVRNQIENEEDEER